MKKIIGLGILMLTALFSTAQTITLNPEKDNSIFSESENSNGTGKLFSGTTCTGDFRRGLIQFDIAGMLPPGATITDVVLTLNVDNVSPGAEDDEFGLYVLNTAWGEGESYSSGGTGAEAIAPDATWNEAMFGTDPWMMPGGDFNPAASAITPLPPVTGDFTWSSPEMITDVQDWLANPATNFGWMIIGREDASCNARRFGSKDEGEAPRLDITYTCAGAPTAICQSITVYLDNDGLATISDDDLDGGSFAACGGDLTFLADLTSFNCEDIFDGPIPPSMTISAIYDGPLVGGTPKGIELYVINDIEDLSIYAVGFANNGGGSDGIEFTFPSVPASAGTYIYLASEATEFENFFGFAPDYLDADAGINGDDAVELFLDGEVIDVFGDIDVDGTGQPWEYMDGWAYRVSMTGPDGDVFNIDNWTFSGINVYDGATTNASSGMPAPMGSFTTAPTVGVPVNLTVTDESGEESTCVAAVFVLDTLAPVVSCVGELTIVLDESGMAMIDVADLDAGTTDGCGIESMSISMMTFTCIHAGENSVMIYATDIYGNIDSCETIVTVDMSEVITISEVSLSDPTCGGLLDGSITISAEGGTPDYTYDWDNDGTGDDDDEPGLTLIGADTYTIIVKDALGCESTMSFELTEPDPILVDVEISDATCPSAEDGSVIISIMGGAEPYTVVGDLEDLAPGDYSITVVDDNGCSVIVDFTIGSETEIEITITEDPTVSLTSNQDDATYQWVSCPDFTPIDGATAQTYFPAVGDGVEFAVIVTIPGGCVDTSDCVAFDFSSVKEFENVEVSLYPNPTNGLVNIKISNYSNSATITVMDVKGSVVLNKSTNKSNELIDLSQVENGIYFIQIKTENTVITKKITVRK